MDLTKISLMRPFIISDHCHWSILCDVYIYIFIHIYIYNFRSLVNILWLCRMEEFRRLHTASGQRLDMWWVVETSHKHKKKNKPTNANTHGFPTGQLGHTNLHMDIYVVSGWNTITKTQKRKKPINANTHRFFIQQLWHIYFFRLRWPTLEKHPLVPALEAVVEPKLNTELANKNFRCHSIQSPETRTGIEFDELQIPRQPSWMCQVQNSAPTPSVELAPGGALV